MSKQFHLSVVITAYSGWTCPRNSKDNGNEAFQHMMEMFKYLCGEPVFEVQALDMSDAVNEHLTRCIPWLSTLKIPDFQVFPKGKERVIQIGLWIESLIKEHGEMITVLPMYEGDVNLRNPGEIAQEINPDIQIVDFSDEPPISPTGDITWKVDE